MTTAAHPGARAIKPWSNGWIAPLLAMLPVLVLAVVVRELGARVVIAVVMFGVAGCAMLVRPAVATVITVFALYINVPAILHKNHGVSEVVAGAFILLLGLPLVHLIVVRRERLRTDASFWLMLAFLIVLLLAAHRAQSTALAINDIRRYLLEGVLIYWLVINVVRTLPTLKRVIWTVLVAGAMLSGLGLYQEITKSYHQEFGGLARRNYITPEDEEPRAVAKRLRSDRAQGPLNEPNRFAQVLVVLLPLAVFAARATRRQSVKLSAAVAGALITTGILLTLSRGTLIALAAVAGVATLIGWIRPRHLLVCIGGLLLMGPLVTPFFVKRLRSITAATTLVSADPAAVSAADGATRGRATAMIAALNVFRDHPVLGVGPGQYTPFYSLQYHNAQGNKFSDMQRTLRAHIMYFEVAAETGVVGLVTFLSIVGVILRDLWRARLRMRWADPTLLHLATACFLSIACYLATAVFLHLSYQRYYWFLLALCSAAVHVIRTSESERADA